MRFNFAWTLLLLTACAGGQDFVLFPPPPPPAPTFHLSLYPNPNGFGMGLGATLQLSPRIVASTGDTLVPPGTITYSSLSPGKITVTPSGLVTAVGLGNSTITASTVHLGQSLTSSLVVNVSCSAELTANVVPVSAVFRIGEKFTPTVSLTSCGGLITVTRVLTWSAVDPSIVSVNPSTGEALGLKIGTTSMILHVDGYGPLSSIQVRVE